MQFFWSKRENPSEPLKMKLFSLLVALFDVESFQSRTNILIQHFIGRGEKET